MRGGAFWKQKFALTRDDAGVTKASRTKADLAWGGTHWKIKFHFTRVEAGVTEEFASRESW